MQRNNPSIMWVASALFVLLFSSGALAGQRDTIQVKEGQFVFNTSITRELDDTLRLRGTVLNNTNRDWDVVHFGVRLFDQAGLEMNQCYYLGESYPLFIEKMRKGELKRIDERITLLNMESEHYEPVPPDALSRYELCFVSGDYATFREELMILGLVGLVLFGTGFLIADAVKNGVKEVERAPRTHEDDAASANEPRR